MKFAIVCTAAVLCLTTLQGCGKYGPPLPPEAFSARAIDQLKVTSSLDGVRFEWRAPDSDIRGKELKYLDGYTIRRLVVESKGSRDIFDKLDSDGEDIAFIQDEHLEKLVQLREEAPQKKLAARKVKLDESELSFEFLDTGLEAGKTYLYEIIPMNQGDIEGQALQIVQVRFNGDLSETRIIQLRKGRSGVAEDLPFEGLDEESGEALPEEAPYE